MTRRLRRLMGVAAMAAAALVAVGAHVAARAASTEVSMVEVTGDGARYWPRWRGPSGQGIAVSGKYTDVWSATDGVKWKTKVPGSGNSSPIVWKDRIFLTTSENEGARLSLLAFDRGDGKILWQTEVPQEATEKVHQKNGYASATPVTDGKLVYASFGRHGLVAVGFDGMMVWRRTFSRIDNYHGPAGSPVLYKDRIFLYQDQKPGADQTAFVAAFDKVTGKTLWSTPRTESVGWGTPVVITAGNRDELIVHGQRRVAAYDPQTGAELWTVKGNTFEVIPTPVVAHNLVFVSSGRAGPTFAIRPGGSGDVTATNVAWSSPKGSPFVPSGIVVDDLLYLINDMQSILTVFEAKTGTLVYQERLGTAIKESFSASPVAVNGKIFFTNDMGETFVIQAGREFKLLGVNTHGARTLASPALADNTWYWRTEEALLAIR